MSHFTLTKTSLLVSTLYLGLMGSVFAAESVDKQLPISSDTLLQIKIQRGDVQIQSWDKNEVSVTGTLDELSEGFVFEQKGNNLNIEDKMPRHYNGSDNNGSKLTIKVPKTVKLNADTISANLQISQTQGELELNTVSGNISADNLGGNPTLHTVSGDITTKGLKGKVMLDTVSGEIKDSESKGEINGDFKTAKEVNVRTVSGDTQVSLAKAFNKANLESVSGDMTLSFADVPDASFELNGGPGGKIKNGLSQDVPQRQKYVPNESLSFQTGAGSASVKMDTISGNLILKKQ